MIETKRLYYFIKVWLGSFLSGILDSLFDAAEALGELGDVRGVNPLINLMKNEEYAAIRIIAGEALEQINANLNG